MLIPSSPDQFLYHYTRSSTVIEHILPHMRLRFSKFSQTNDPRENKKMGFGLALPTEQMTGFDVRSFQNLVTENLQERVRILCLTADSVQLATGNKDDYERGFCHSRMWAQYADRHTGMCLMLDASVLKQEIERSLSSLYAVYSGRVHYHNVHPDGTAFNMSLHGVVVDQYEAKIREHIHEKREALWFTKLKDWSDEQEFRWVLWAAADVSGDAFVSIKDALKCIVVGCDCPVHHEIRAHDYGRQLGIRVHRIHWSIYSIHLQ